VDLLFVRSAGRVPGLKDIWWAVFLSPIAAGLLASLWSRRAKMGKRVVAGITAGALVGLAYGLINTYLAPFFPGFVPSAAQAASSGAPALAIIWKTFLFAPLGIPGAFIAETRRP
jgi:cytochrome bd-type quinol oxidase subunit 2